MPKNLARSFVLQEIDMLESVIIIVHLVMALALVGLVLIQQGKGAEAGASATVFGAQGTGSFFSRITGILAAVFFLTSLALAFYAKERSKGSDELGLPSIQVQQVQESVAAEPRGDIPQLEEVAPAAASDIPAGEQAGGDIPQAD